MNFRYRALVEGGTEEKGTIEAYTAQDASRRLSQNGLVVLDIAEETERPVRSKRIKRTDVTRFFDELTTLLGSGVTLVTALEAQSLNQANPSLAAAVAELNTTIQRGGSFSEALDDAKDTFRLPPYLIQLARAGELTGRLAPALRRGVELMQYEERMTGEIRGALTYPIILIVAGIAAVGLVFTLVVPKFAHLLEGEANLHWLAEVVLSVGLFVNEYGLWIALLAGVLLFFFGSRLLVPAARLRWLNIFARVPIIGPWLVESETGRWTSVLGNLLGSDVDIVSALDLANSGVRIESRRRKLENALGLVRGGDSLSNALQQQQALTAVAYNMIRVGESSGRLPDMLGSLAALYEKNGRERMNRVLALMEPLAILLIGATIGVILIGIALAISSASDIPL